MSQEPCWNLSVIKWKNTQQPSNWEPQAIGTVKVRVLGDISMLLAILVGIYKYYFSFSFYIDKVGSRQASCDLPCDQCDFHRFV